MWDLPHLVLIQKARHALRAGRLDEAYAIATDGKLADHRKRQTLLEDLVAPFVERARKHLEAGRAEEAAADIERARVAGGNRPEVAEVRERALEALRRMRRERDDERKVLASVEGHLARAEVAAGADRLEAAPAGAARAADLRRRIDRVRKEAEDARAQAERHLVDGDVLGAIEAAALAHSLACDDAAMGEVALRAGREAEIALAAALRDGNLAIARALFEKIEGLARLLPARDRWREALELCDAAARAVIEGDWSRARVSLKRLAGLLPGAAWVLASEEKLKAVEDALHDIRSGPLGRPISAAALQPERDVHRAPVGPGRTEGNRLSPRASPGTGASRSVLWVDGVGSYLILAGDRVTIGRPSTSAKPDIALLAELEGIHAEILRVEQDYFLVPRGPVTVGGKPVKRHLLADGDEFLLGARSRLTFRMPTSLSPTAILELGPGLRLEGDVRKVVLLDGHLIIGPGKGCHIETARAEGRVILSAGPDGFRLRAPDVLVVDGSPAGPDEPVPFGAHVEAGSLTFTLTRGEGQGGPT